MDQVSALEIYSSHGYYCDSNDCDNLLGTDDPTRLTNLTFGDIILSGVVPDGESAYLRIDLSERR